MNLLWMGLFAGIIFAEKMWSRGIWVARAAGIQLAVIGILVSAGMLPSLVSSAISMTSSEDGTSDEMMMEDSAYNNNNHMAMDNSSPEASMDMSDNSMASETASDEPPRMAKDYNGQTMESMDMNDNNPGEGQTQMMDME